jgi:hypothetical protein
MEGRDLETLEANGLFCSVNDVIFLMVAVHQVRKMPNISWLTRKYWASLKDLPGTNN